MAKARAAASVVIPFLASSLCHQAEAFDIHQGFCNFFFCSKGPQTMKSLHSSPLAALRRLPFLNPKFLSSQPQFPTPHSESPPFSGNSNPSTDFYEKITSKSDFPEKPT
ncbi:hypothetical protein ACFX2H_009758 [Malus domestica]